MYLVKSQRNGPNNLSPVHRAQPWDVETPNDAPVEPTLPISQDRFSLGQADKDVAGALLLALRGPASHTTRYNAGPLIATNDSNSSR